MIKTFWIEYLQEKNYQLEKRLEELLEEKQNNASKNRNEPDKVTDIVLLISINYKKFNNLLLLFTE